MTSAQLLDGITTVTGDDGDETVDVAVIAGVNTVDYSGITFTNSAVTAIADNAADVITTGTGNDTISMAAVTLNGDGDFDFGGGDGDDLSITAGSAASVAAGTIANLELSLIHI